MNKKEEKDNSMNETEQVFKMILISRTSHECSDYFLYFKKIYMLHNLPKFQPTPANEITITKSDIDKMETAEPGNDSKKISTPTKLSITPTSTNNKIESRVKTVVARDKATGKKV